MKIGLYDITKFLVILNISKRKYALIRRKLEAHPQKYVCKKIEDDEKNL